MQLTVVQLWSGLRSKYAGELPGLPLTMLTLNRLWLAGRGPVAPLKAATAGSENNRLPPPPSFAIRAPGISQQAHGGAVKMVHSKSLSTLIITVTLKLLG